MYAQLSELEEDEMEVELTPPQHSEKDELEGSLELTPQQQQETVDQKVNI